MQDFDISQDEDISDDRHNGSNRDHLLDLFHNLLKKLVVFISFGPGVLGVLWFLGKIFKR